MSGAPPKKKPFAFTSGPGGAPLPPPAAAAPEPKKPPPPRLRRARRRTVAVEREALGATKEAAAAAVAAAAAAPGGAAPRETEDEARVARGEAGVGLLVCDEAHRLKGGDDRVEAAAAIGDSPARKKLFVTATPVQNGVPELENLLRLAARSARRRATRRPTPGPCGRRWRRGRCAGASRTRPRSWARCSGAAAVFVGHARRSAAPGRRRPRAAGLTAAKHLCSSVRALDAALDDGGDTVGKWNFAERLLDAVRANDAREKVVLVARSRSWTSRKWRPAPRTAARRPATLLALGTSSPDAPCALFAPGGPPEYRGDAPLAAAAAAAVQVDHLPDRFAPA
ncbi:hypothetical protein JL721_7918 [Aureococcus anophagefferens]|nr:hypothetical protein JL721_7918 [Aureococcus anophagefferens]